MSDLKKPDSRMHRKKMRKNINPYTLHRREAINAKYGKKGSEYRAGTEVPAIEESLYTEDDLG